MSNLMEVTRVSEDALLEERHAFAEELGQFFEERGLPRTEGRVLGWLMVCPIPHQSAEELVTALGASRGAISMATRLLQRSGAVERVAVPGSRRHYYQLRPAMWRAEIDKRVDEATRVRELAADGLKRLAAAPREELQRVRDMHEMYAFLADEYRTVQQRWNELGRGECG